MPIAIVEERPDAADALRLLAVPNESADPARSPSGRGYAILNHTPLAASRTSPLGKFGVAFRSRVMFALYASTPGCP